MSKRKKKNRNNQSRNGYSEKSRSAVTEETRENAEDATQELTFDISDFEENADDGKAEEGQQETAASVSEETSAESVSEDAADTESAGDEASEETVQEVSNPEAEGAEETYEEQASEEADDAPEDASSEEDASADDSSESSDEKEDEDSDDEDESDSDDDDKEKDSKRARPSREALREQSENERVRREARHKRRIRQQVTAYFILILIIAIIGTGLYFGVKYFVDLSKQRQAENLVQQPVEEQQPEENVTPEPVIEELPPAPTVEDLGPTPSERLDAVIENEIAGMNLEEKVQALMFITPETITGVNRVVIAGDGTRTALEDFCPGGIMYSSQNVTSADQFTTMLSNTTEMVSRPVFFATTETGLNESGLVGTSVIESVSTPSQVVASGNVEDAVDAGMTIGMGLQSIGITVDFAPLADLAVTNGGIGDKAAFGSDAASVTPYVTGMADGLSQSGVISALRYFPSLAASSQNPAYGRAVCDRTLDDFRSNEFQVWLSAINAGARMIQMSNVIYPSIDSDSLPSSLSEKTVTGVLRDELGYGGVIISGPLNDAAITSYYTASESAVMALKAGCDMICTSPDPKAAVAGIMEAVDSGVISEERINDALIRIFRIRYADALEQFRAEYEIEAASLGVDLTGVQY